MAIDRPTGSVTGKGDWDWNRWQEEVRSGSGSSGEVTRRSDSTRSTDQRGADRGRRIRELETELERSEHRRQYVIDHYERLLREKNRKLTERRSENSNDDGWIIAAAIRCLTANRR